MNRQREYEVDHFENEMDINEENPTADDNTKECTDNEVSLCLFEEDLYLLLEQYRKIDIFFNYVNYNSLFHGALFSKKFYINKTAASLIRSFSSDFLYLCNTKHPKYKTYMSEDIIACKLYCIYYTYFVNF